MLREAIATGETVQQAYENACRQLGVETYMAEQEILELPVKKTFRLFGGSPAKVRAFIRANPSDKAADYLRQVLTAMGVSNVQISEEPDPDLEGGTMLRLEGDQLGFVIGHRGEVLDALQYLAGLVANHEEPVYSRITLNIGDYREKRKETLRILGIKLAHKALKTGRNCKLEPMNPYERRILHAAVQEVEGVRSWSEGQELHRHVVIGPEGGERPVKKKPFGQRPGASASYHAAPRHSSHTKYSQRPSEKQKPTSLLSETL